MSYADFTGKFFFDVCRKFRALELVRRSCWLAKEEGSINQKAPYKGK